MPASELKKLLGLQSLSGIVYSITEIPVDLIREIVDARIAELAGGAPLQTPVPADVEALVMERLKPILRRLATLEQTPAEEPPPRHPLRSAGRAAGTRRRTGLEPGQTPLPPLWQSGGDRRQIRHRASAN